MYALDGSLDYQLDVFAQHQSALYTQICLCFPLDDNVPHSTITAPLEKGLQSVAWTFPWIAGQVVKQAAKVGDSGIVRFRALWKCTQLIVRDFGHDASFPHLEVLCNANSPVKAFHEEVVCPLGTRPKQSGELPVFVV